MIYNYALKCDNKFTKKNLKKKSLKVHDVSAAAKK